MPEHDHSLSIPLQRRYAVNITSLLLAVFCLICLQAFPGRIFAQEAFWYDGQWAHEHSDLRPDPSLSFERLDNGFRYALIPGDNPPGRAALYLDVQAGGLMEEEYEHGFAHLIEHMAFNGSRNFPPDSLIPFFQEHGMSFGGDTNAHTSSDETVYKLNLSDNSQESLAAGMLILRDIADGLLFDPEEVTAEIQVVLAEKAARENENALARDVRLLEMYPDSLFKRPLIGTEESIASASPAGLRAFYDKWYRPEQMILTIVGSITKDEAADLVLRHFGDLEGRGPEPTVPDWGETHIQEKRYLIQNRPITAAEIAVYFHHPRVHQRDSSLIQQQSIIDTIATYCFRQRISQREQIDAGVWRGARFSNSWRSSILPSVSLTATSNPEGWQRALTALAEEIRDVLAFGFQDEEINQAIEYYSQIFTVRALQQLTLSNGDRAMEFINIANLDRVYTSVQDDMERFEAGKDSITPEVIHQAFRGAVNLEHFTIYLSGDLNTDEAEIRTVWETAINSPPMEFVQSALRDFPYLPLPPAVEELPSLHSQPLVPGNSEGPVLHTAILDNGVELYFLPLAYEEGTVKAELLFGPGFEQLGEAEIDLARMAGSVLREGGLGDFNRLETRKLFTNIGGQVLETHSVLSAEITGSASSNKLNTLLTAVWTQFMDPAPKESALNQVVLSLDLQRHRRFETVSGVDNAEGYAFFNGDGQRFRPVEADAAHTIDIADLDDFLARSRQFGPIRLLISGDFDPQAALAAAARLFNDLKINRRSLSSLPNNPAFTPVFPSGQEVLRNVPDSVDKAVVRIAWHCDLDDLANRRLLAVRQLAAQILGDHIREEVRERMGATYSPQVNYTMSAVDNGYGFMTVEVQTRTAYVQAVLDLLDGLRELEIDEENLERLRGPMRTSYQSQNQRNELWHRALRNEILTGKPYALWHSTYLNLLDSISAEEVSREIASIFQSAKGEWIIVSSVHQAISTITAESAS